MFSFSFFSENKDGLKEWSIIELQGDLEVRGNQIMSGQFIGDLSYDKYGQPVNIFFLILMLPLFILFFPIKILIIGHHILHGKEQKIDKPFAVLQRVRLANALDRAAQLYDLSNHSESIKSSNDSNLNLDVSNNRTVLDTTVAIEHKTKQNTEYLIKAIVSKKLVFISRPKPIIANVAKQV